MSDAGREFVRKYRVHGLFRIPDTTGDDIGVAAVQPLGTQTLLTAHYDAADLRLTRDNILLRRCESDDGSGWTLELPGNRKGAASDVRDHLRLPIGDAAAEDPPPQFLELLTAHLRTAPLGIVATLQTERTTSALIGDDGAAIGELVDDVVSVLDNEHVAARFRELQLAGRNDRSDVLTRVDDALLVAGAVAGQSVSTAAQALGPRATAAPEIPEAAQVRPADPAALAIAAHLATHVAAFRKQDVRVRRDLPGAVHQMRVAARRLRSGLRVFAPLVEHEWAAPLRTELRWIAAVLGEVRDREVLLARLERSLTELRDGVPVAPTRRLLENRLGAQMSQAREELLVALRSERYIALVDMLVSAAQHPRTTPVADKSCAEALPPLVNGAWRRLRNGADALQRDDPDEKWHDARIDAKKARYAAEACSPVFGAPAKDLARQFERVTELLGEHQDAAVAAETVTALARESKIAGSTGFALGLLHARERQAVSAVRREFEVTWPQVRKRKWRAWLTAA